MSQQGKLFDDAPDPEARPSVKLAASPYLVDILAEVEQPDYSRTVTVRGRDLTITVAHGSDLVELHMAGAQGGKGDALAIPRGILFDICDALRSDPNILFPD